MVQNQYFLWKIFKVLFRKITTKKKCGLLCCSLVLGVPKVWRNRNGESQFNSILLGEAAWREGGRWVILLLLTYLLCLVPGTAEQLRERCPKSLVR